MVSRLIVKCFGKRAKFARCQSHVVRFSSFFHESVKFSKVWTKREICAFPFAMPLQIFILHFTMSCGRTQDKLDQLLKDCYANANSQNAGLYQEYF